MKKGLLFLASLMLGTSIAPLSNSYHKIPDVTAKRLSNEQSEEENVTRYLATEASRNSEEQKEVEAKIASFVSRNISTTDEEEASKYDLFFNYGSDGFWDAVGLVYLPSAASDFVDFAEAAQRYAIEFYNRNKSDDASDAFRHIYLIAMITATYGRSTAEQFYSLAAGYTGPDIAQQNRHTMDCHNNPIGVRVGLSYPGYSYAMTEGMAKNMARYVAHVTKYGSYYDVYEMTANDMGFIHTTEGRRNSLFPPYC